MATIQFKRGSTANLQNIIPAAGEPVWDKELQKLKVGDGTSLYSALPYVGDVEVDGSSIKLLGNAVSLFDFDSAEEGMSPIKQDGILKWTVFASQSDIESIIAEVDAISDYINSDLAEALTTINNELIRQDHRIDVLDDRVDDHEQRLDALEDALAGIHPEEIQAAVDKVETFDGRLDLIEDTIGEAIADHETVVELKETVNNIVDRVETLEENSLDINSVYTTDDIMIIDGGTEKTVIIEDHRPVEIWED